jgi:excisionase family DNA binding protein
LNKNDHLSKRLYRLKEASVYLGRPCSSIRNLIHNGQLPVVKEGRTFYLDVGDLDKFIERHKITMNDF